MSADPTARRRVRLAVIVTVGCGIVAAGVTGAGLLVPSGSGTPLIRIAGAVVSVAAGGALVRLEGPGGAARAAGSVAVVATAVCLLSFPVSPVTFTLDDPAADPGRGADPADGAGVGPDVTLEQGVGDGSGGAGGAIGLPPGTDVVVEGGQVLLTQPGGGTITLGQANVDGAPPPVPDAGTALVVVDGVVGREDGGAIGGDVALGGLTIERSDGSRVTVGDGRLYDVPPPVDSDTAPAAEPVDAVLALLLGLFALLAFAPPLVRVSERVPVRLLDDPEPEPTEAPAPVTMEEGLAEVLRSMLADPDPRTSVIGAYARLLTAMDEAGFGRRAEEGPHEHLWRTLGPLGVRRQPVHRLAELFVRARFTPRPVTEADRQAAIAALADAVGDLRLQATDVVAVVEASGVAG